MCKNRILLFYGWLIQRQANKHTSVNSTNQIFHTNQIYIGLWCKMIQYLPVFWKANMASLIGELPFSQRLPFLIINCISIAKLQFFHGKEQGILPYIYKRTCFQTLHPIHHTSYCHPDDRREEGSREHPLLFMFTRFFGQSPQQLVFASLWMTKWRKLNDNNRNKVKGVKGWNTYFHVYRKTRE